VILFVVISINYYLMMLLFSKILERIKKDLEKGLEAERTKWRHILQLELESTSDFMSRPR